MLPYKSFANYTTKYFICGEFLFFKQYVGKSNKIPLINSHIDFIKLFKLYNCRFKRHHSWGDHNYLEEYPPGEYLDTLKIYTKEEFKQLKFNRRFNNKLEKILE